MKTKRYLPAVMFFALLAAAAFLKTPPAAGEETRVVSCYDVGAYVADTDPRGVNVRSGPGQSYPVVTTLAYHTDVTIMGSAGEWVQIDLGPDSQIGWVSAKLLAVTATTKQSPEPDPSGLVPILENPYVNSAIVAWAPEATELGLIGCVGGCVKVRYRGVEGWLDSYSYSPHPAPPGSGGTKTTGMEVTPCDNVAAFVIDKDANGVNLRSGPGVADYHTAYPAVIGYPAIGTLPTDRPVQVRIVGVLGDWVLIKDAVFTSKGSGEMTMEITGWVKAPLLGVRTHNPKDYSGPVSLYKEPDAASEAVA
ncbi:MAG: SH3 domain-containing protein, partial [Deltaproteobacteria bacterium]|nr:SH3 domain-containing protein [Candidatus Zymogenaceae bacterium]